MFSRESAAKAVITADWAIAAPALNSAAPAERSPKGDSVSATPTLTAYLQPQSPYQQQQNLTHFVSCHSSYRNFTTRIANGSKICHNLPMAKTSQMQIRLDDQLKADAESVLSQLGLSPTEYIRMSLRQLVMRKGIPFEARIFNEETIAALNEDVSGNKRYSGPDAFDEMMKDALLEKD